MYDRYNYIPENNKTPREKSMVEQNELSSYIIFSMPSPIKTKKILEKPNNTEKKTDEIKTEIIEGKCNNPNCDHNEETKIEPLKLNKIDNLDDLIKLGNTYHCKTNKMFYNINLKILFDLIDPLTEIKNIIG